MVRPLGIAAMFTQAALVLATDPALALPGEVLSEQKISDTVGGFVATLDNDDNLGHSVAGVGDLDGDGVPDIAVGSRLDDDGAGGAGAVYVLLLNANGTVKSEQKISNTAGGFSGTLDADDRFGSYVEGIGDLDGDGVNDIAVGVPRDDDGGTNRGAVWILFLNTDGTVKADQKLSDTAGGKTPVLDDHHGFSTATAIGDLDGNGTTELAVGANGELSGTGAVWILFLLPDGTAHDVKKISPTSGGFGGSLDPGEYWGSSVEGLGDVNGDGVPDLAVGAHHDGDGGTSRGSVWILFLDEDGTVKSEQKISDTQGGFTGVLDDTDTFGYELARVGDLDGDGVVDLAVGARGDDDGGTNRGAVWILFLNTNGTVKGHQKISDTAGTFLGVLDDSDLFGQGLGAIGDVDGDGIADLGAGAFGDDDGGTSRGATWILNLDGATIVCGDSVLDSGEECDDGNTSDFDGCTATCENEDRLRIYGRATTAGLLSAEIDGVSVNVAVSSGDTASTQAGLLATAINTNPTLMALGTAGQAPADVVYSNGRFASGTSTAEDLVPSVRPGAVLDEQKISASAGGFVGTLGNGDSFGYAVAGIGNLDGDGIPDLAVGAPFDDDGGSNRGAVWILFLNADGTEKTFAKISASFGGFTGNLADDDHFGYALAALGDLDGDGHDEFAVGAPDEDDGGPSAGALWIVFPDQFGAVKAQQKISGGASGGFTGTLDAVDNFGISLASLGDLDGDGVGDLAVGAHFDDDGGPDRGAVWILFLNSTGTVKSHQKISDTTGGFGGGLANFGSFGRSVAALGDVDGDGIVDLAVGAPEDGTDARGAVWILFLDTDGTVQGQQKISDTEGGFDGLIGPSDWFGFSLAAVGDVDANGVPDLAVGAPSDDDQSVQAGSTWMLLLESDGTVSSHQKLGALMGGVFGPLSADDWFGSSATALGDLDGDGRNDIAVGAPFDDDGGPGRGAVWILMQDGATEAVCADFQTLPPETCDDGNTTSGDGCYATCEIEDEIEFVGTAQGGSVSATVSGVSVVIGTVNGQSASTVATNLRSAINVTPSLDDVGVSSVAIAARVITNGVFDSVTVNDPGIAVPEPSLLPMLFAGSLLLGWLHARRARGESSRHC